ncbi:hypothetical protein [Lederbergia lenta]|uniref:hypothetical protein n=1 Tax=Lederbergia lenta TaxID=1467 RepID=UPI00203A3F43|nr:hypothetical protein [Lederbergia lenta]MCM3110006.1 hypothetical protein [Lederbergia lenta]
MSVAHNQLHDLINKLSDKEVKKVYDYVKSITIESVEPTKEEIEAIKESKEDYKKGEYYTFEEVFEEEE